MTDGILGADADCMLDIPDRLLKARPQVEACPLAA
jgi:hypothetical protein